MLAVVAAGPNMRASGVEIPSSRGIHIRLCPVVGYTAMAGIQEKVREDTEDPTTENPSTGLVAVT